jgi:phosphate transport system protein
MTDHTVRAYDAELVELRERIAEMGGLAEKMLSDAMQALLKRDLTLAQVAIAADRRLDLIQREVEDKAVLTITKRQPVASDLREIVAAMRLANDIERIGDLAKNIAKRVVAMNGEYPPLKVVFGAVNLATLVLGQLKDVLDAYAQRSAELSLQVWRRDDEVDALYTSLFRELLTYMMEDPRNITFCTHLLFCAKNIERIGDHATNIAENAYYLVTGELLPVERPKADTTAITPLHMAADS